LVLQTGRMLATGAELIKTSATQAERLDRFNPVEGPSPIAKTQTETSLDSGTQDALMRFAKFIHKEKKKKPVLQLLESPAQPRPTLKGYLDQLALAERFERIGSNVDIYR
jgi:hypothetical protein